MQKHIYSASLLSKSVHPLHLYVRFVWFVDIGQTAADVVSVQIVCSGHPEPDTEVPYLVAQQQISPHSLIIVGTDRESIIDIIFVGVLPFIVTVRVKIGNTEMKTELRFPKVERQILIHQNPFAPLSGIRPFVEHHTDLRFRLQKGERLAAPLQPQLVPTQTRAELLFHLDRAAFPRI